MLRTLIRSRNSFGTHFCVTSMFVIPLVLRDIESMLGLFLRALECSVFCRSSVPFREKVRSRSEAEPSACEPRMKAVRRFIIA